MKLLINSHSFAPHIGGVETIVLSLAQGLTELKPGEPGGPVEVTVVTQTPAGGFDDAALPFRVVRRPGALQLWRLIRGADVVHVAGPALLPLLFGWVSRKPVVVEHHGYQAMCPNGVLLHQPTGSACPGHFLPRRYWECLRCNSCKGTWWRSLRLLILTGMRRALCQRVAANLAITGHVLERHALHRSSVVYYGIRDSLAESSAEVERRVEGSKPIFAYVGRFVPEKGLPVLLDALAILRKEGRIFELRLIGDGPERAKLDSLIHQHALSSYVRSTGFLTGDALRESLRDVWCVIMPSIWEETAGLAAIEQMMRGRLVVVSAIGGLGEVVGDAGLKCRPGDAASLAGCLRRVLDDPSLVEVMGRGARDRALQLFARPRMIEEHAAIYRRIVSRSP